MRDELSQIDEMASDIVSLIRSKNLSLSLAALLHHKGYRKATDVVEDIIRILRAAGIDENRYPVVAELKKKYTFQ